VVARTLHEKSRRSGGPFVAVNCGALPPNLIEAELFGHEKGAFTGAVRSHRGYFERAAGGTLFLDEVTEMSLDVQVRLLRVLETGRFTPVGGNAEVAADCRIVAATNRDPVKAVREGRLREDLMYRLAVFPIPLPPLRARGEDVVLLTERFLDELNRKEGTAKRLSSTSLERIRRHAWPGNVRELQNAVQRAFILADESLEVEPGSALAPAPACGDGLQFAVGTPLSEMERAAIHAALAKCAGDKHECARLLGISLKTLDNRLAKYAATERVAVRVRRSVPADTARRPAEAPAVA
jgi:two-component system response regulator HydG